MMYQLLPSDWTVIALIPGALRGVLKETVGPPSIVATPCTRQGASGEKAAVTRLITNILPVFAAAEGSVYVFVTPPGLPQRIV